jgi:hypothetical protein
VLVTASSRPTAFGEEYIVEFDIIRNVDSQRRKLRLVRLVFELYIIYRTSMAVVR